MEEKRYLVYEATVKLIKSPVFILAAVLYAIFTVMNFIPLIEGFDMDNIVNSIIGLISVVPALFLTVGLLLMLIAVFSDNYSPFSIGVTLVRIFAIISIITTIVPSVISLIMSVELFNKATSPSFMNSYVIGYYLGMIIPMVLYTVFYVKVFQFADNIRYSAESDIPHPEEGKFIAVFLIVISVFIYLSLFGLSTIISTVDGLSAAVIIKAVLYDLFAILIFIYRNKMKKDVKLQQEEKQNEPETTESL